MEKHFIQEGIIRSEIENYLKSELNRSGYSGITIQKTPLATRVILYVEKPPLVIGKKGKRINRLTRVLQEKYGVDNPAIDVQKIEVPTLDANIVSRRIAVALERGMNRRRVIYKALRAVMGCGARGIEITLRGKLVGKGGRSRTEKYLEGYMKKAGDSSKLVDTGLTQAYLKAGVIGVTVKIVRPDVIFPDQIEVISKEARKERKVKEAEVLKEREARESEAKEEKKKKTKKKETKKPKTEKNKKLEKAKGK
ncbi:MAG: 30S ribosomal protein S3 [Candidatus Altiarchaeales archaeon]|nr:30S ribosomal protein S3 [Candidatus Altiarchaeota archaeon]MCG2782609.1 30S ribosomal protein S3 [Candidatus Altiarchaeales archaeon]MBU4265676.1 30S ribosomal protein S3 [Candidatus Altiarchaeota archaeon]MBU4341411.1 30S ribosomal protein S3 [Candidatus Altiarchaeota archaeon]MBU4406827.1 30S ribosomal protein S3 [Candidatus Altiarchaeota archaeon]